MVDIPVYSQVDVVVTADGAKRTIEATETPGEVVEVDNLQRAAPVPTDENDGTAQEGRSLLK